MLKVNSILLQTFAGQSRYLFPVQNDLLLQDLDGVVFSVVPALGEKNLRRKAGEADKHCEDQKAKATGVISHPVTIIIHTLACTFPKLPLPMTFKKSKSVGLALRSKIEQVNLGH